METEPAREIGVGLAGLAERVELLELGTVLMVPDRKNAPVLGVR